MKKERIVKMVEFELELDDSMIEPLKKYALAMIAKDEPALLNYAVNKALEHYVNGKKGKRVKK